MNPFKNWQPSAEVKAQMREIAITVQKDRRGTFIRCGQAVSVCNALVYILILRVRSGGDPEIMMPCVAALLIAISVFAQMRRTLVDFMLRILNESDRDKARQGCAVCDMLGFIFGVTMSTMEYAFTERRIPIISNLVDFSIVIWISVALAVVVMVQCCEAYPNGIPRSVSTEVESEASAEAATESPVVESVAASVSEAEPVSAGAEESDKSAAHTHE